jgi:cytochrome b6-f complex iron-sulfur subunit
MENLNRREFIKLIQRGLAFTGIAALAAPLVAYFYPTNLEEMPSEPVLVCGEGDLPEGYAKLIRFGRYPALVLNTPAGLRAYSAVCTHFGCIVKWDTDRNEIVCPCHDGYFNPIDGSVISGPPPEPLLALPVKIEDGQIYVGGEA